MSESAKGTAHLACYTLLRKDGKIPFVLREHTGWMNGFYSLPAGRVEREESIRQGAARESLEEVGAHVALTSLRHLLTVHRHGEDRDWLDVYFEATEWEGEVVNGEPDIHSAVEWFSETALPDTIIPPQRFALDQIAAGVTYAEYGWDATN